MFIRVDPRSCRVHSHSFASVCPGVVGFIRVLLVNLGATCVSSYSLGFVCFIYGFPGCRMVNSRWFGEFGRAQGVVVFIGVRLLPSRVPQRSSCSFALVW